MKAFLKNYRQSPRKVRLVATLLKGKTVAQAIVELDHLAKRAGEPIQKLLISAAANAKSNFGFEKENLVVKELRVDKGIVMKRMMPAAMGSGHKINKRTSHITVLLEEKGSAKPKHQHKKDANMLGKKKIVVEEKVIKEKKVVAKKVAKKVVKK